MMKYPFVFEVSITRKDNRSKHLRHLEYEMTESDSKLNAECTAFHLVFIMRQATQSAV